MGIDNASAGHRGRGNAIILSLAQALAGAHSVIVFEAAPLVGARLAPAPGLATVPVSVFVAATAFGTLLAGALTRRHGRRPAFLAGAVLGAAAGLVAALGVREGSFATFCAGTALAGLFAASAVAYRFAAAEGADDGFRDRAMGWVLGGGVLSAVLGTQVAEGASTLLAGTGEATFLGQGVLALPVIGLVLAARLPGALSPASAIASGASLPGSLATTRPVLWPAIVGLVASYVAMNAVMTVTPLAMAGCGLSARDSNLAIQWHVLAMYAPSFLTGDVVGRFGTAPVAALGLLVLGLGTLVHLLGNGVGFFWTGTVLLGLGWNLAYVACSSVLARIPDASARARLQAAADFLVMACLVAGSAGAGVLLDWRGWPAVNMMVLMPTTAVLSAFGMARAVSVMRASRT